MNGNMSERLRFIAEISLLTGLLYSAFEGVYYFENFPIGNLFGFRELALKNLAIFLILGLAGYLFVTVVPQKIRNRMPDLIPVVLSLLISFPAFFFLFYLLEGTSFIYRFVDDPKTATIVLALPFLVLFYLLSYPLRDQRRGRYTAIVLSAFFFVNPGQYHVEWTSFVQGEARGFVSLGLVLLATWVIYMAAVRFQTKYLRGDLLLNYRLGLRNLLLLLLVLALIPTLRGRPAATKGPAGTGGRPNVLLIVLDTARADRFSCYGYGRDTTPFLESFAEGARVYPNAFSAAPWTLPSHASIFTGLYPSAHGATWKKKYLEKDYRTLAEVLLENGYRTIGFCNNPAVGDVSGLDQGFEDFVEVWRDNVMNPTLFYRLEWFVRRLVGRNDGGALRTNQWVSEWLDRVYPGDRPFFLFVNLMECHLWYDAPDGYHEEYIEGDLSPMIRRLSPGDLYPILTGYESLSEKEWRDYGDVYDGDLNYLDRRLEDLFRYLDREGYLDETLVVITSDHGEHLGEHGMIDHMLSLYQPLLHVPLIIRTPAGLPELPVIDGTVQTVDIYPTVLSLVGLGEEAGGDRVQGVPLVGDRAHAHEMVIAEHEPPRERIQRFLDDHPDGTDILKYDRSLKSIQVGSLKYIWSSTGGSELYDLAADPSEGTNLIHQRGGAAKELEARLEEWLASFEHASAGEEREGLDKDARQRLKALGYVD